HSETVRTLVEGEEGASGTTLEVLYQDEDQFLMVAGTMKTQILVQNNFTRCPWLKIRGSL
ncbi:hypothetical protein A2U01_0062694, partial [Trifolium medium]|nr:hypothetical protein [Trifolium medium]